MIITTKKGIILAFLAFSLVSYQPAPAHASFFLFNIIHDIFTCGQKNTGQQSEAQHNTIAKNGTHGEEVIIVQQYLIKAKYLSGTPDGVYGSRTIEAVKAFQRDSGLTATGAVDTRTMNALKNARMASTRTSDFSSPKSSPSRPAYYPSPPNTGIPSYLYTIPVIATAYTRYDEGCGEYTYRGSYLRRGLVAVDPNIIPLGTRLYVPGYGDALADDIGGAIQGNRIDLAMDTLDEAFDYGRREVTVYVLPKA